MGVGNQRVGVLWQDVVQLNEGEADRADFGAAGASGFAQAVVLGAQPPPACRTRTRRFLLSPRHQPALLRDVLRLAQTMVPSSRITVTLDRDAGHMRASVPLGIRVIDQPAYRGSAPELLLGLISALIQNPHAMILVTPASYQVANPELFQESLATAYLIASGLPDHVLVVGAETGSPTRAARSATGGLRDTRILMGRGRVLFEMFATTTPELARLFTFHAGLPAEEKASFLDAAYRDLPSVDLATAVLSRAENLAAYRLPRAVGWADLTRRPTFSEELVAGHRNDRARLRPALARWPN